MREALFAMMLAHLEAQVASGAMTPEAAIKAASAIARAAGADETVVDALEGRPPVMKGGEQ